MSHDITKYGSPVEAAVCLAARVESRLRRALLDRGCASLVVSGGTTPRLLFEFLSRADLDWGNVWITLADERWVDESDAASNARLVRSCLMQRRAAAARFVSLKSAHATPAAAVEEIAARLQDMPRPFEAVLLGMGDDGHTASLFPGDPCLGQALAAGANAVAATHGGAGIGPRMTLTLPTLLDTSYVAVLVQGPAKQATLDRAVQPGPVEELPVRAILRHAGATVEVHLAD